MSGLCVVLSGGGAKAAAHCGALRALGESGARPERYVATSMGAVVAVAAAAGLPPDEILVRLARVGTDGFRPRRLGLARGLWAASLLHAEPLRRALEAAVPVRRFDELAVPVTVTACAVDGGARVLLGAGGEDVPVIDALMASCALPLWLPAVRLAGRRLVDGGLRGALPLEPALGFAPGRVFAVDVAVGFDVEPGAPRDRPPVVAAHDAAVGILLAEVREQVLRWWRSDPAHPPLVYVRPLVPAGATFDGERARDFADAGYRAARAAL